MITKLGSTKLDRYEKEAKSLSKIDQPTKDDFRSLIQSAIVEIHEIMTETLDDCPIKTEVDHRYPNALSEISNCASYKALRDRREVFKKMTGSVLDWHPHFKDLMEILNTQVVSAIFGTIQLANMYQDTGHSSGETPVKLSHELLRTEPLTKYVEGLTQEPLTWPPTGFDDELAKQIQSAATLYYMRVDAEAEANSRKRLVRKLLKKLAERSCTEERTRGSTEGL